MKKQLLFQTTLIQQDMNGMHILYIYVIYVIILKE